MPTGTHIPITEPGLESPDIFSDPLTYIGGGVAGLLSKLAAKTASKAAGMTAVDKIASLRRAARRAQTFAKDVNPYNPQLMRQNWERVRKIIDEGL